MKLGLVVLLFFIFSLFLLYMSVKQNAQRIYAQHVQKVEESRIQPISDKRYRRTKKAYVPERSLFLAEQKIKSLLLLDPIHFGLNNNTLLKKPTLYKIVKIVNHVKDDVVLSILAHTDSKGTSKYNLYLSQERANRLKEYFTKKIHLSLIVAIGYGEVFSLENSLIEINLKRIKK